MRGLLFLGLIAFVGGWSAAAQSVYTMRPEDAHAVDLTSQNFGARGDGAADDSDALQRAIDRAQETVHHGIVLVPEGRYRLTRTIHVWAGILDVPERPGSLCFGGKDLRTLFIGARESVYAVKVKAAGR